MSASNTASGGSGKRNIFSIVLGFVRDIRFLQAVGQILFLILVFFMLTALVNQIFSALIAVNSAPNFTFLQNRAGFELANAGDYSSSDSYAKAFEVGLRNTINVVVMGLIGATLLGILGGILLLSSNWLLRTITRTIVEILRNTPLLVQIIVVYFFVLGLPLQREAIQIPPEGVLPIPFRLGIYLFLGFLLLRSVRNAHAASAHRKLFWIPAFLAVIFSIEGGFWLTQNTDVGQIYETGLSNTNALLYLGIFSAAVALGGLLFKQVRLPLWGIVIGQLVGAGLLLFGIVPANGLRIEMTPAIFLSNRGLVYPQLLPTGKFAEWALFLVIGLVVAVFIYLYLGRVQEQTGQPQPRVRYGFMVVALLAIVGWIIVTMQPQATTIPVVVDGTLQLMPIETAREQSLFSTQDELLYAATPLVYSAPVRQGLRFNGGLELSQNYLALLGALVIYTAAFIAEIVRAGILAVPKGQLEASRALGLTYSQMLIKVILPQALRVIIPPLGNQYLNLSKNSSLALAIAYADVYAVMYTVINQSGQSVTGIVIIMLAYLVISLIIAALMNWVNGRFQLKTR